MPLLLASFAFNYLVGDLIHRARAAGRPRAVTALLTVGVSADVAMLVWFKYATFAVENIDLLFGASWRLGHILLPLAISFFTFQEIAYLIDTARGETKRISPLDFALFAAFYPRLIAGPIVRFREVVPQFQSRRFGRLIPRDLMIGLVMFAMGLFKKTVIADTLAPYVDGLFSQSPGGLGIGPAWLAAISFTIQVYFDFSGYSDMAMGVARMFGVKLPLNFHSPFRAGNIIDYWRRWHMTLQRFVVSYLFQPISLALNRLAASRGVSGWSAFLLAIALPIFITFVVLGIWHGAGWTFAVFGAMHGVYLSVNEAWREHQKRVRRKFKRAGRTPAPATTWQLAMAHGLTLAAVLFANVMFRSNSIGDAVAIWGGMLGLNGGSGLAASKLDGLFGAGLALGVALVFLFPNTQQIMRRFDPALNWREWRQVGEPPISWTWKPSLAGLIFAGLVLFLGLALIESRPATFIYFNF